MQRKLWQKLNKWSKMQPISMHVPGHKNGTIGDMNFINPIYDITEITGFDDLHHPEEVLYDSMKCIQKHEDYEAVFLVNGTTSGILAVIQAFQSIQGDVCIGRHSHKSVFNALDLGHQCAHIMHTQVSHQTGQYNQPEWSSELAKKGKLGVVTYPNYYGETFDVQKLIQQFHEAHIPVLVDEAHGAHFGIEGFPKSTLEYGADYVVQSYHKTLPSLTMTSMLFIHKNAPYQERVKHWLQTFQSSSPSYLFMASLEQAQGFYETYQSDVFFEKRQILIKHLKYCDYTVLEVDDPLKLVIRKRGVSGELLKSAMEAQSIFVELADAQSVLWVLPLWYTHDRFPFKVLLKCITHIHIERSGQLQNHKQAKLYTEKGRYTPEDMSEIQTIPYEKALGCTLAQHLIPYPPGVPTMYKGEIITKNMIELIRYWHTQKMRVEGMRNGKIKVKDDL